MATRHRKSAAAFCTGCSDKHMFSKAVQSEVFLATIYAGLAAGALYDILRLLRLFLHSGKITTALLDGIFWVAAAFIVSAAVALSGENGLRFYVLLGIGSGMLLWAGGLRRLLRLVESFLLRIVINVQEKKAGKKR